MAATPSLPESFIAGAAPKVSVLIITYNQAKYIAQAIESALMQRANFDFRIVIGEDCSTDGTREIVEQLHRQHPKKIHCLMHERNLGALGKNNLVKTLEACTGHYVALLEGDDFWSSADKLQRQVDFLENHPGYSGCFHDVWFLNEQEGTADRYSPRGAKPFYTFEDLLDANQVFTPSSMYKRSLLKDLPAWFFKVSVSDWPFVLLAAQGGPIGYLPDAMSVYRMHPGGVSSGRRHSQRLDWEVELYEALAGAFHPRYERFIRDARLRAIFWAASFSEREGAVQQAKQFLASFLRERPLSPLVPKQEVIKLLMRLYAPNLFHFLKRTTAVLRGETAVGSKAQHHA